MNTGSRRLGPARFTGPHSMAADDGRSWSADRVIIAMGGHAGRLPIPGAGHALTYEDIPSLTSLPGRVAVVGGADAGCQIASIFEDFGAAGMTLEQVAELQPPTPPSPKAPAWPPRRSAGPLGLGASPGSGVISGPKNEPTPLPRSDHRRKWI